MGLPEIPLVRALHSYSHIVSSHMSRHLACSHDKRLREASSPAIQLLKRVCRISGSGKRGGPEGASSRIGSEYRAFSLLFLQHCTQQVLKVRAVLMNVSSRSSPPCHRHPLIMICRRRKWGRECKVSESTAWSTVSRIHQL